MEEGWSQPISAGDCCAICLCSLKSYQRKLHKTECGHVFHETCFEKITGELRCPCCRGEVQPVLKQQIRIMDHSIKDMSECIRMFPMLHKVCMEHQNEKIQELEEELRKAKHTKRVVSDELYKTNKYNKSILEQYKITKKSMLEQQREELAEYQSKKAAIRSEAKSKKQAKKNIVDNSISQSSLIEQLIIAAKQK